ncbi:MAG TPA: ribosomal L7Ae/L30e/S12e/Gadd45 family protein [Gemmatimonadales bacterium]|nr:ribosomal L7Ae/L30e/S12e/Gadd45 family protein [Gemmatimonadales bacterium]
MSSLLGLLGLGRNAGALVIGADAVHRALQQGRIYCVVLAADASERAREKVVRLAQGRQVPVVAGPDADAIGIQLGKPPVMAVGVRDRALADGLVALAPDSPEEA